MTAAVPIYLQGPPPVAPEFTLVGASQLATPGNERWMEGASIQAFPTDVPQTHDPCATGSAQSTKPAGTCAPVNTAGAFAVVLGTTGTGRGVASMLQQWRDMARTTLLATESFAVEREFWDGLHVPVSTFLTKANSTAEPLTVLNGGGATNAVNGMALLEGAIAATGRAGMIHATPKTVTAWIAEHLIEVRRGWLRTYMGTPVVPGYGYTGNAPAGQAAISGTAEYAFATGPIQVLRSDVFAVPEDTAQMLDRSVNTLVYRVERYYLLNYDGSLRAGVKIDRCQSAC